MNINREEIAAIRSGMLERTGGFALSENEIEDIAANFDDETVRSAASDRLTVVKWDRESPINNVPAEDVLAAREDIPEDGVVYLVCEGDTVLYFQPFKPGVDGYEPIAEDEWEEVAGHHKAAVAEDVVRAEFSHRLMEAVNEKIKNG